MSPLYLRTYDSRLGMLSAAATDKGLFRLDFDVPGRRAMVAKRLALAVPDAVVSAEPSPDLEVLEAWLSQYFAGGTDQYLGKLDLVGTSFELLVWRRLFDIPTGSTTTYAELSTLINVGSPRAVGTAVGKNPVSLVVPCHRVIGSDGSLTGYAGGIERKAWLLQHEGARLAQASLFS